jgi:hypothetical protein
MKSVQKWILGVLVGLCFAQVGCRTTGGARNSARPEPQVSDGFSAKNQPRGNPVRNAFNTFRR